MNIQIFGKNKCFDTKKAQRWFKERGIKFQMIDLAQKGMSRGELDSVLPAAFCHHPENYISLMEYYTPEEHGMEPFTRK